MIEGTSTAAAIWSAGCVGVAVAMGRIVSGVVTGIGFIGGGAILKKDGMIEGTSTAAAIWSAGCVGVAVAMGRLEIAVLISVFMVAIFYFVSPIKETLNNDSDVP